MPRIIYLLPGIKILPSERVCCLNNQQVDTDSCSSTERMLQETATEDKHIQI